MFGRIAKRYDTANRVLSAGIDRGWRRRLVEAVGRHRPARVLDLATGSGDVAFAIARGLHPSPEIIGMDFCQPMLDEAEAKRRMSRDPEESKIRFLPGDGLDLPLPDGPSSTTNSPANRSRSTPRNARTSISPIG